MSAPMLRIVETTIGYYSYHLSEPGSGSNGEPTLCGRTDVMRTSMRLVDWNSEPTHIRSKFCKACSIAAGNLGVSLPAPTEKTLVF